MKSTEVHVTLRDGTKAIIVVSLILGPQTPEAEKRERGLERESDVGLLVGGAFTAALRNVLPEMTFDGAWSDSNRVRENEDVPPWGQ